MEEHGFEKKDFREGADIYVINTCSVTDHADKKCRKVVKEALKYNAEAKVVVVGCYAQLKPNEIASIPGVNAVLGAAEKFNLVEHLGKISREQTLILNKNIKETNVFVPGFSFGERTRSFMKVQDGCDYFCSFCTIPLARGKSRSQTVAETIENAKKVAQTGVKEIVLTGVNLGDFGVNHGETFFDLVKQLDELEGVERFRISSIEPNLLTNDIIKFVAQSKKFVPHFHIPLQSGSNSILKLMRRKYERELYENRVRTIKTLIPHCCIGVDVIVGFPHETNDVFLESYNFINSLDVSYLHVFPYSERPNTTARKLGETVPVKDRMYRAKMLRILSEKKRHYFYTQNLGKTFTVLYEAEESQGKMYGFTENYIKVEAPYDPLLINELVEVQLIEINENMNVVPLELSTCLTH